MQVMSPFTPFFTEAMYQNLRRAMPEGAPESVHFFDFPKASCSLLLFLLVWNLR